MPIRIPPPPGNVTVITPNDTSGTPRAGMTVFSGAVVNSDLATEFNGFTRDATTGIYKLTLDVYLNETCDLSGFGNVTIDIGDKDFYVHPNVVDATWRNVVLRMTGNRGVGDRFVFKGGSLYNAIGGGFIHAAIDRPPSGDRRYLSVLSAGSINNVQLRAEDYSLQEIDALTFLQSGEYSGVSGVRVKRVSGDSGTTRLLLHDCEFNSSVISAGTQIGAYHNANVMINDCKFLRYSGQAVDSSSNDWLDTFSNVTDQAQYIYLMGSTASLLKTNWANRSRNNLTRVHAGSLKYFQVFLEGSPVSDFAYRVFSRKTTETNSTIKKTVPTLTNNEMLYAVNSSPSPTNGRINLALIKSMVSRISTTFTREEFTDIVLKIRNPKIQFLDHVISDAQAIVSQGRPDNAVPLVIQPDPNANFDEISAVNVLIINTEISFNFSTRVATATSNRTWTPAKLYAYYRFILSEPDNFVHEQEWTFDGNVLDLGGWSLVFGNANTLNVETNKGREIRATRGQITTGTGMTNNGIRLIDVDGVSVRITSNVAGTRIVLKHGTTTIYRTLPFNELLPLNTEINVTAKAPGYIYQKYSFNTGSDTSLEVRLPKDPSVELETTFTSAEINVFSLLKPSTGRLTFRVGEIFLGGQLEKSKRIIDALLSTDRGLEFLADYVDELSGSPLNGSPILFESYRIRMDVDNDDTDGKIRFLKTATDIESCRIGSPVHTPAGVAYRPPRQSGHGAVVLDNIILSNVDQNQIAETVVGALAEEGGLLQDVSTQLNSIDSKIQTEFDNIRLGFFEHNEIENNDYVNGFVSEPDDIIMIRGTTHNGAVATVGDIISKYDGQIQALGDASRHIYRSFTSDANLLSVCNYNESGSKVFMLAHSTLGHQLVQIDRDGMISAVFTNTTADSRFALIINQEVLVLRSVNGKLVFSLDDRTENVTTSSSSWTFDSIDLASTGSPSAVIWNDKLHVLINDTLHLFTLTKNSSNEITDITWERQYNGYEQDSILCVFQKALWLYKDGEFTPLDYNYNQIRTEWDKFSDAIRLDKIEDIPTSTSATVDASAIASAVWNHEVRENQQAVGYLQDAANAAILLQRLTPTRASNLDHLNHSISGIFNIELIPAMPDGEGGMTNPVTVGEYLTQGIPEAIINTQSIITTAITNKAVPTTTEIRTKMQEFGSVLSTLELRLSDARAVNLDARISSRLAAADYTAPTTPPTPPTPPTAAEIRTELETNDGKINKILATTKKIRFDNGTHVEASIVDVNATPVSISDFRATIPTIPTPPTVGEISTQLERSTGKIKAIEDIAKKFRFSGTADAAGTQKVEADATVTGTVDSSGLTDTQASQLSSIYSETVVDGDNMSTNIKEAVDSIKTTVEGLPTTVTPVTDLSGTNAKIDAVKSVVDDLPTTVTPAADFTGTNAKIDAVKTVVDALPTTVTPAADFTGTNAKIDSVKSVVDKIETQVLEETYDNDNDDSTDNVNTLLGDVKANKEVLDKFNFNSDDDVKATLDSEIVDSNINLNPMQADVTAIKTKTDKLQFTTDNDVKSTLDGEEVTTDSASRTASKATGFATASDIPTPPTVAQIRSEMEKNSGFLKRIRDRVNPLRYDNTSHVESSVQDVKGSSVRSINDFKATGFATPQNVTDAKDSIETAISNKAVTPATDLTGIARTTDVTSAKTAIETEINANETKIDSVKTVADDIKSTVDTNLDATVSSRLAAEDFVGPDNMDIVSIKDTVENIETHITLDTHDHDGDDSTEEVNTLLGEVKDIKAVADKIGFSTTNDVKATLDGETVTTDAASRTASKATGFATPANVTAAQTSINTAINTAKTSLDTNINANETKIDSVKSVADTIKTETDKIQTIDDNVDAIKTETDKVQTIDDNIDAIKTETDKIQTIDDNIDAIETETDKIQTIDDNVDTILTQTTADAISTAIESALLNDDDGRTFIQRIFDTIEQAIEDESLTENAFASAIRREVWSHVINPDDPADDQVQAQAALNKARNQINRLDMDLPTDRIMLIDLAKAALDWLVRERRADIVQTHDKITLLDRDTKEKIIEFDRIQTTQDADWSGGKEKPIEGDDS